MENVLGSHICWSASYLFFHFIANIALGMFCLFFFHVLILRSYIHSYSLPIYIYPLTLSGFFWQSCSHSTFLQQILGYRASDAESSDMCRSGWSIHLKDPIDNKGVGFQHSWLLLALNQKRKIVWCEDPTKNFVYSFRQYGQESIVVIRQIQTVALRMNQNEPKN